MGEVVLLSQGPYSVRHMTQGACAALEKRTDMFLFPRALRGDMGYNLSAEQLTNTPLALVADGQGEISNLRFAFWFMNETMRTPEPVFMFDMDVDDAIEHYDTYKNRHDNLRKKSIGTLIDNLMEWVVEDMGGARDQTSRGGEFLRKLGAYKESPFKAVIPPLNAYLGIELHDGNDTYTLDFAHRSGIELAFTPQKTRRFIGELPLRE